ncbi:MAG: hypothetical protein ABSE89_00065 [Sedimentisphaerales bacterium]
MRKLQVLSIIAIVAMLSTMVFAVPPWDLNTSAQIPVVMDIVPSISIDLNGSQIKLLQKPGTDTWEGFANPMPIVHSNVDVKVSAKLDVVHPNIQLDGRNWGVALQGQPYTTGIGPIVPPATFAAGPTPFWFMDVPYIGAGRQIPIAVEVISPDLTVRPPELNSPVAIVTLTVQPS